MVTTLVAEAFTHDELVLMNDILLARIETHKGSRQALLINGYGQTSVDWYTQRINDLNAINVKVNQLIGSEYA